VTRQDRQREVWRQLGADDPDWGVLTHRDKRGGGWEDEQDAFYASGVADVEACLALVPDVARGSAVDLGSGTGRLSFALAAKFEHVTSVDAAESMLAALAGRAGERGVTGIRTCHVDDLGAQRGQHDFLLSLLVLQHLESPDALWEAAGTALAALRPGGGFVLEIPSRALHWRARTQPRFRVYALGRRLGLPAGALQRRGFSGISMLALPQGTVVRELTRRGAEVTSTVDRQEHDYVYTRYVGRYRGLGSLA
jgi:2-polyprenyl-3-methyl-5-hydroxy-6-metoxy-1,4-benzoquinol methylase